MGFGGISAWQLGILLLIVAVVFGTRRLRNVGSDVGAAVRGFREGMKEDESAGDAPALGVGAADQPPGASERTARESTRTA